METDTNILFVRPGFTRGMSRVVDFWGDLNAYNVSPTGADADELALQSDVAAIGQDLRKALKIEEERIASGDKD